MKKVIGAMLLLLCVSQSFGQNSPTDRAIKVTSRDSVSTVVTSSQSVDTLYRTDTRNDVTIFYRFDRSEIDPTYLSNQKVLDFIDEKLSDTLTYKYLDSLSLNAISSPEGPLTYNMGLSERRVKSFKAYLVSKYPDLETKIKIGYSGEEWENFRRLVVESTKIPNKDEVLKIIDSDDGLDAKEYQLKHLNEGKPWRFIVYNILKYLRYGGTAIFHYSVMQVEGDEPEEVQEPEPIPTPEPEPTPEPVVEKQEEPKPEMVCVPLYERKPLFALKTNLLYDIASVLNISAEVPLNDRFSLAGEWTFPWWTFDNGKPSSKRHRIQLLQGNIEGRYWMGNRDDRPIMTGWFAGLYGGSGKYDFEYSKDGVQGEFYTAGLSAGYAHSINKKHTLRMEYSVSGGYLHSNYRDYNAMYADTFDDNWHPIRRSTGKYSIIAPTSVKVSLVWMLYYNRKVKGGTQWYEK